MFGSSVDFPGLNGRGVTNPLPTITERSSGLVAVAASSAAIAACSLKTPKVTKTAAAQRMATLFIVVSGGVFAPR